VERCSKLFTPDTILRWHRDLIAGKYDGSQDRMSLCRPPISEEIQLVIRLKEDNPRLGYGEYDHHKHIHPSLGRIMEPKHKTDPTAKIVCIERLRGLLKPYHRLAA
jgi:hypothetical protein